MRRNRIQTRGSERVAVLFGLMALPVLVVGSAVMLLNPASAQVGGTYGGGRPTTPTIVPAAAPANPAVPTEVLSNAAVQPDPGGAKAADLAVTGALTSNEIRVASTFLFVGMLLVALSTGRVGAVAGARHRRS